MNKPQKKKPNFFTQFAPSYWMSDPNTGISQREFDSMGSHVQSLINRSQSGGMSGGSDRGLDSEGNPMQREDGSFASQEEIDSWELRQVNKKWLHELGKKGGMSKKELEKAGAVEIMEAYEKSGAAARDKAKREKELQAQFQPVGNQAGLSGGENISFLEKLRGLIR